jgi:hypothetical protein
MNDVKLSLLTILVAAAAFWLNPRPQDTLIAHCSSAYYPSCPNDVFKVRRILLESLPPELVHNILDEAHYWPRIGCAVSHDEVGAVSVPFSCLVTPALPTSQELGGRFRVRQVKFVIRSNDQGLREPEYYGASLYRSLATSLSDPRRNFPYVVRGRDPTSRDGTSAVGMAKIGRSRGLEQI